MSQHARPAHRASPTHRLGTEAERHTDAGTQLAGSEEASRASTDDLAHRFHYRPMAPSFDRLRIRLIQIREKPDILAEEKASFLTRAALAEDQLVITNAIREPLAPALADGVDAIMIGGAGAFSVTKTYAWTQSLIDLCHTCADREVPLFGSCWGHQFIARAFGGEVIHDPSRSEMGTVEVELTEAGKADALLGTLPARFDTQAGHQDRVSVLPPGGTELAANDRAPFQAFRIDGTGIYGTQFHTELDKETEKGRLVAYRDHYPEMQDEDAFQAALAALRPSPHADDLLRRWLLLYAVEGGAATLAEELA
ncbi:MAG: type 1 glutamine amidotransferase [Bacteroidota bacterium]